EPRALGAIGTEAVRGLYAPPRDRHAAAVASRIGTSRAQPHRVAATFGRDVFDLGQAELLALVDVHRAGQGHGEQGGGTRPACAALEVGRDAWTLRRKGEGAVGPSVAGDRPGDVVVREHPRRG